MTPSMIPIMRPRLPMAGSIFEYLKTIDLNRWYSNFGELEQEYRARLAELFGSPVVTASSATSALTATLLALGLPPKSKVAVPSWTFPATPASIIAAGHEPFFVDIAQETGAIQWAATNAAAVIVVSPFGAPLDIGSWDEFSRISKIPVVIDAAAGFDSFSTICKPGHSPVVISTHATKVFGTGEGGFVTCHDEDLLEKIRRITNFGLTPERDIKVSGINAKMSEYHAAVGLVELDGWKEKREMWIQVAHWYYDNFMSGAGMNVAVTAKSTMAVQVPGNVAQVAARMLECGIQCRTGIYGCHQRAAYAYLPTSDLSATSDLIDKTIYLPMYVDMTKEEVVAVCNALKESI